MSQTSISAYFHDVGKHNLLTKAEEVKLAIAIQNGSEAARAKMIQSNLRLAVSIAKKYQNRGCDLEDLIQEANVGLMKAVTRFDHTLGFKFSTYACWWIKQTVRRHITSHSTTIRMPSHAKDKLWKIKGVRKEYEEEFGVLPTMEEVADILGTTVETLRSIESCSGSTVSIDKSIRFKNSSGGSEGRKLADIIPDDEAPDIDAVIDRVKIKEAIREALGNLSSREEKIVRMRFGIVEDDKNHEKFPITTKEIRALKAEAKKR